MNDDEKTTDEAPEQEVIDIRTLPHDEALMTLGDQIAEMQDEIAELQRANAELLTVSGKLAHALKMTGNIALNQLNEIMKRKSVVEDTSGGCPDDEHDWMDVTVAGDGPGVRNFVCNKCAGTKQTKDEGGVGSVH